MAKCRYTGCKRKSVKDDYGDDTYYCKLHEDDADDWWRRPGYAEQTPPAAKRPVVKRPSLKRAFELRWKLRSNPAQPANIERAIKNYEMFHALPPKRVGKVPNLPKTVYHVGKAIWTYYESPKWENKNHAYKHEHEAGVKFYICDDTGDGKATKVPGFILKAQQSNEPLIWLGKYLGGEYEDFDGEIVDIDPSNRNDLFMIPDRTALIIASKTQVEAIIWGGNLNVIDAGIVG